MLRLYALAPPATEAMPRAMFGNHQSSSQVPRACHFPLSFVMRALLLL